MERRTFNLLPIPEQLPGRCTNAIVAHEAQGPRPGHRAGEALKLIASLIK
jgi:hypothetical protein